MADAVITHFQEFEREKESAFNWKAMQVVGSTVYEDRLAFGEVTNVDVSFTVVHAAEGSTTSATAGTEVKIQLDDEELPFEEWPFGSFDFGALKSGLIAAKRKSLHIKQQIGERLLGGVSGVEGAIVNVNVQQAMISAWYGVGFLTEDRG